MEQSWSQMVGTPDWRRDVHRWIRDILERRGASIIAPIEQPRIRPWSTQMIVTTDSGRFWFKANCPANAFEPRLQKVLAELVPGDVEAPVAIDGDRGWMLTWDHGSSLGDRHEPTQADWEQVVSETARVQRALAGQRHTLLAAGLPDYSPATVPGRLDSLIERLACLPPEHPSHLTLELAAELERARPQLDEAARQLEESPVASTFQHGDVHPWNVFVSGERMGLFDFGDAQWAFPFEAMAVPHGLITQGNAHRWEPVRDAYREHWSDVVTAREFDALWNARGLTYAVNRSAVWWRGLQGASHAEWTTWGQAPRTHLLNLLDADPAGGR